MTSSTRLFAENRPSFFWRLVQPSADEAVWTASALASYKTVFGVSAETVDAILDDTLGEGRYGPDHWRLSAAKRIYYEVKPFLPRRLTRLLRQVYGRGRVPSDAGSNWPVEDRYVSFLMLTLTGVLDFLGVDGCEFLDFWPHGKSFGFVLTHDIETADGQRHVIEVADLEQRYGFHSSFNFVPERYPLDHGLMTELVARGFEVGIHDLHHDGKLFQSRNQFEASATRINRHASELSAVGFRAALTHRNPEWMQDLHFEYDLSFFDTDPYEPIPGGSMTIWPFRIGRLMELPYTLVQDYTLTAVLAETTPSIWLNKVDYIATHRGMALLNTHPDYLVEQATHIVYERFLAEVCNRDLQPWHGLPRDAARWWQARISADRPSQLDGARVALVTTEGWSAIKPAAGSRAPIAG